MTQCSEMTKEEWMWHAECAMRSNARFLGEGGTIEWFTGWMIAWGQLDPAPEGRWIGPVVQKLIKDRVLKRKGWAPAKSSHYAPKRTYCAGSNA